MLSGKEELECKVWVDMMRWKHVSEFKYFGCILDESDTDESVLYKGNEWARIYGAIMSLVDARGLYLLCARVLHESLVFPVLMYCAKKMIWRKERYRIKAKRLGGYQEEV